MNPLIHSRSQAAMMLLTFCLLCTILLLSSCSNKNGHWGDPLAAGEKNKVINDFEQMVKRDAACPPTVIADLAINYTSPLINQSVNGFLQFSLPENYKFVITNPLGQIFWAAAGDRTQYQIIDTTQRLYSTGDMQTLVLKHQLPIFLLQNNWGEWLLARNQFTSAKILTIRQDNDGRGVWFTVKNDILQGGYEHLLIEPDNQVLLQRIIADRSGDLLATITYDRINKKRDKGQCIQPEHITITGLNYGSSIELWLSAIEFQAEQKRYRLPHPPSYRHISATSNLPLNK